MSNDNIQINNRSFIDIETNNNLNIWLRRLISFFEIGGGLSGFSAVIIAIQQAPQFHVRIFLAFSLYSFGIIAGFALIENRNIGVKLSKIFYAIQIPLIISSIFCFHLFSGIYLVIKTGTPIIAFVYSFGSRWYISFLELDEKFGIGINIIALVFFIILHKSSTKRKK